MTTDNQETLLNELKSKVNIRNQMGSTLYYNILNDECCQIASKCEEVGIDTSTIKEILGEGTFTYIGR